MSVKMINMELGITKQSVMQGTTNYVCSEQYIEMMVKVSVMNILYHRLPVPDIFYSKEFHAIPYKVVRNEHVNAPIIQLYRKWMNGFKDAFRKKYIEELLLFFYNDETKEIEENFVFKFFYEQNINKENACTDLTGPTENLLKTLISLGDSPKLDGKSLSLHVEMFYSPDTPMKYKPDNFVEKNFCNTLSYQIKSTIFDKAVTFARLCSKFHYFKGTYNRKLKSSQLSIESESVSLEKAVDIRKDRLSQTSPENETVKKQIKKKSNRSILLTPCASVEGDKQNYIEKKILDMEFDILETTRCEAETSSEENNVNSQISVEPESELLVNKYNYNEQKRLSQCSTKTINFNETRMNKSNNKSKSATPSVLENDNWGNYIQKTMRNMKSDIFDTDNKITDASERENNENSQISAEPESEPLVKSKYKRKVRMNKSSLKVDKFKKSKVEKSLNKSKAVTPILSEVQDHQNNIEKKMHNMESEIFDTNPCEAETSLGSNNKNSHSTVEHKSKKLKTKHSNQSEPVTPCVSIDGDKQNYIEKKIYEMELDIFDTALSKAGTSSDENENSQFLGEPELESLIIPRDKEKHRSQTLAEMDDDADIDIDIFETAPSEVSDSVTVDISYGDYRFPNDEDIDLIVSTVNSSKNEELLGKE